MTPARMRDEVPLCACADAHPAALPLILLLGACQPAPTQTRIQGNTMGTYYAVTLSDPFPGGQGALQQEVEALLARLNKEISTYDPGSLISRFNQGTGQPPRSSRPPWRRLCAQGIDAGHLTRGSRCHRGPLVNLWGFGPDKRPVRRPGAEQIAKARERVGIDKLTLTPRGSLPARQGHPRSLSGSLHPGRGAASDEIAGLLEQKGPQLPHRGGGGGAQQGHNDKGNPWRVAIVEPSDRPGAIEDVVTPNGMAVSTAGSYRNYYELDGQRYSHIIDPATGEPVTHKLVSATVITPTALEADALDTALMVMGPERAMAFAREHKLAVYLIEKTATGFAASHTPSLPLSGAQAALNDEARSAGPRSLTAYSMGMRWGAGLAACLGRRRVRMPLSKRALTCSGDTSTGSSTLRDTLP